MISENPEKKADELDADIEAVPLCTPNVVTTPDAGQEAVIAAITKKKAVKKAADLQKAEGVWANIFKKELTVGAAKDAFEVALGEQHFNDDVRNELVELMVRDISDVVDAAISPDWNGENQLVARWNDELKNNHQQDEGLASRINPGEMKLLLKSVYDRAAGLVSQMGYKDKSIKESAKAFDNASPYDEETGAEKRAEFKVFKSEKMKVFTDNLSTNLPESHRRYDPAEYWVIVETDDENNAGSQGHQKVYIGVNQSHAELRKQRGQSGGWYDASRNAVTTAYWKKEIEGDFDKIMKDSKKGK